MSEYKLCKWCGERLLLDFERDRGLCVDCQVKKEHSDNINELNRFRAIFPVPPWSTDPITPEVCERLGLVNSTKFETRAGVLFSWWQDESMEISVRLDEDETWIAGLGYNKTAGQLSCIVAARREDAKH